MIATLRHCLPFNVDPSAFPCKIHALSHPPIPSIDCTSHKPTCRPIAAINIADNPMSLQAQSFIGVPVSSDCKFISTQNQRKIIPVDLRYM